MRQPETASMNPYVLPCTDPYLTPEMANAHRLPLPYAAFIFMPPHNEIRVALNNELLEETIATGQAILSLTTHVYDSADTLFAPWYRRTDGSKTDYDDPEGRAWNHAEIAAPLPPEIEDFDHDYIYPTSGKYWHYFNGEARILTINVPEGKLVLDGNHRLASHLRHFPGVPVDLPHYHIEAPNEIGRKLLPDIQYWT